jgi:hypothetical protein
MTLIKAYTHMTNGMVQDEVCGVQMSKLLRLMVVLFVKARVLEQRRWNRWGLVARAGGAGGGYVGMRSLSRAACDLALCHMLRNFGERSGVPKDPGKYTVELGCERASEGTDWTPMRKKIHPAVAPVRVVIKFECR